MIGRVILMCAGRAERWGGHLGTPKHLIPIDGEPLLDRTVRLVRENTQASIVIVAFDPAYDRPGCERHAPAHGPVAFCDTDKFLSAESRWSDAGQTVILYGDVFFSDAAMRTICSHAGPHRFFGRRERSDYTGCPWREMFALSFPPDERTRIGDELRRLRADLVAGRCERGGGWELFHQIHGRSWAQFTQVDDFTDDFDYPADYERWIRRYRHPVHRRLVPYYGPAIKHVRWRCEQVRRAAVSRFGRAPPAARRVSGGAGV